MRTRPIAALARQSVISAVALAGLNSLALLYTVESAAAGFLSSAQSATARKGETCGDKHAACTRRCVDRYDTGGDVGRAAAFRCVSRTCDKQHDNCTKETGQSTGDKLALPPRDTRTRHPFSIPSGGILSNMPGLPSQGPSATGSPAGGAPAAPSAPPVIIR
jgi:hypothetical protein